MNFVIPILAQASTLTSTGGEAGLTGAPDLFSSGIRMVSALAITLGILFFVFYFLRRSFTQRGGAMGSRGLIRVISTTYLGNKASLVLADVAGQKLVLGISPQAITLVAEIKGQESLEKIAAVEKNVQGGRPFYFYLEALLAKRFNKRGTNSAKG